MSLPAPTNHAAPQPRLDAHNINIDTDSREAGECGTLHLADGWICRQAELHQDGCTFQAPSHAAPTEAQA